MSNLARGMEHPDANLLAAFTEQSLTVSERNRVLLHLSACDHCREIVFLTQQSEPVAIDRPPAAAIAKEPRLHWSILRTGWVALPSLAAILLAVFSLHWYQTLRTHRLSAYTTKQASIAQNYPVPPAPPAPPVMETNANTLPAHTTARAKASIAHPQKALPPDEAASTNSGMQTGVVGGTANTTAQPSVAAANEAVTISPAPGAIETKQAQPLSQIAPLTVSPAPLPVHQQAMMMRSRIAAPSSFSAAPDLHPSTAGAVVAEGKASTPHTPALQLPSGLHAVSFVQLTSSHVALDQEGNLFLRSNRDEIWKQVAKQWTGKAAALTAIPSPQITAGFMTKQKGAIDKVSPSETPPPATLRLINDTGHVWTSTDSGETWHAQPAASPQ